MRNYINLVESMMLNEFLLEVGDGPNGMFELNVFTDTIGEDPIVDELPQRMARKYTKLANAMAKRIESLPNMPLLPTMVRELEDTWYDGSDAYDDDLYDALEEIYDEQLKVCEKVIGEIEQIHANPAHAKTIVITNLLNMIKSMPGDKNMKMSVLGMIDSMREIGMDYPEFDVMERSLKSGLDEETISQSVSRGLRKGIKAGLVGTAVAIGMGGNYQPSKSPATVPTNVSTHMKTDYTPLRTIKVKKDR